MLSGQSGLRINGTPKRRSAESAAAFVAWMDSSKANMTNLRMVFWEAARETVRPFGKAAESSRRVFWRNERVKGLELPSSVLMLVSEKVPLDNRAN